MDHSNRERLCGEVSWKLGCGEVMEYMALCVQKSQINTHGVRDVIRNCTSKEGVLLEVLNAVLTQSVLAAANEPANQVLRVLRHVRHLLWELESLLCKAARVSAQHETQTEFPSTRKCSNKLQVSLWIQCSSSHAIIHPELFYFHIQRRSSPCGS